MMIDRPPLALTGAALGMLAASVNGCHVQHPDTKGAAAARQHFIPLSNTPGDCCESRAAECSLDDGCYQLVPVDPATWGPNTDYHPLLNLDVQGLLVLGEISWTRASPRTWYALKDGTIERGTSWCVEFKGPLFPGVASPIAAWSTGHLHILGPTKGGYLAALEWDQYDSRFDLYYVLRDGHNQPLQPTGSAGG